jgi:hypothetical protein
MRNLQIQFNALIEIIINEDGTRKISIKSLDRHNEFMILAQDLIDEVEQ